jgi:hypothetical protein
MVEHANAPTVVFPPPRLQPLHHLPKPPHWLYELRAARTLQEGACDGTPRALQALLLHWHRTR